MKKEEGKREERRGDGGKKIHKRERAIRAVQGWRQLFLPSWSSWIRKENLIASKVHTGTDWCGFLLSLPDGQLFLLPAGGMFGISRSLPADESCKLRVVLSPGHYFSLSLSLSLFLLQNYLLCCKVAINYTQVTHKLLHPSFTWLKCSIERFSMLHAVYMLHVAAVKKYKLLVVFSSSQWQPRW